MADRAILKTTQQILPVKAVLFDLDGTLLDTLPDLIRVTNATLLGAGYPERGPEEIRWFIGNGSRNLLKRALPSPDLFTEELFDEMIRNYLRYQNTETKPFRGIRTLLRSLRRAGIRTAIVTNKPDPAAQEVQKKYFGPLIDYTVGIRGNEAVKPDSHTALEAMRFFGVTPEETAYVGDSDTDFQTSANAGTRFFGAAWGYRGEAFLREHGAETILHRPTELLRVLGL